MGDEPFQNLIRLVRQGDAAAGRSLVARYEALVQQAVRRRLRDTRLHAAIDPLDVAQEVFADFFVRVAVGDFDLPTPQHLERLLTGMARRQLAVWVRRERTARRDVHRTERDDDSAMNLPAQDPEPGQQAEEKELLRKAWSQLTEPERELATWRLAGQSWAEIGERLGKSPTVVRKRYSRVIARMAELLKWDE